MPSRKRSPHPGIVVLQRNAHHGPRCRWRDPATGRMRGEALPDLEPSALRKWLVRKSLALTAQRIASTPPPGQALALDDAVEKYFREIHRLRERTRKEYRYSVDKFRKWAAFHKVRNTDQVTQPRLRAFRAAMDTPGRAAASVNCDLTHVAACLEHLRKAGDMPRLARDDITSGLQRLPKDFEKKTPLSIQEIRVLICSLTPPEGPKPGTVHERYRAFVLTLLLTGMRAEECRCLRPAAVDLTGAGRIALTGAETKTRKGRVVDLSVCPLLKDVLTNRTGWPAGQTFFNLTRHQVRTLREQLHPTVTFQRLRVTCGTYLTCAPGIYGGASAYMSAKRLGHSVTIAESNYVGEVVIPLEAKTLEAAMGLSMK
jgi:integrase